jgi:hypothetical protein
MTLRFPLAHSTRSLGNSFSTPRFLLHVIIHTAIAVYVYIFINGHTLYFLRDGAGGLVGILCLRAGGRWSDVFMSVKDSDKVDR